MSVPVGRPPRSAESSPLHAADFDAPSINASKVQRPPLRDQTLARPRLLDWLASKIHHRVVFVVAEAGYGKTTLLADFAGRTRTRTLWYRLDEADRDWSVFIRHLVAAVREHDRGFGEATSAAFRGSAGDLKRQDATEAFLRDLTRFATESAVFVYDDFHAVDDADDVRHIVSELVRRAPERISFVFSSRRTPSVKVARLRAQGEVAELATADLRFSDSETEQLFRETYGQPLETDLLDDLSRRTEGWAASLQLVQAAIRDRSAPEIRRFVRSLTGAEGDLYDYLAEEVVGELPEELQDFLMKVSLLESVEPALAAAAAGTTPDQTAAHFAAAERLGVLGRRGRGSDATRGFHPLVRDFLRSRFGREAGDDAIRETHTRIARAAEQANWSIASFHYLVAGFHGDVHRVIRGSIQAIMGSADFLAAASLLDRSHAPTTDAEFEALRARAEFRRGYRRQGIDRAKRAFSADPQSHVALMNLVSLRVSAGDMRGMDALVRRPQFGTADSTVRSIMEATAAVMKTSVDGNLADFVRQATAMADEQHQSGLTHYEGISLLNAALAARGQGNVEQAALLASRAGVVLEVNSTIEEIVAARLVRVWALAHSANWRQAVEESTDVLRVSDALTLPEALAELAKVHLWYGDIAEAKSFVDRAAAGLDMRPELAAPLRAVAFEIAIRSSDFGAAEALGESLESGEVTPEVAFAAHCLALHAYLAIARGSDDADARTREAIAFAEAQGAGFWARYVEMLSAVTHADVDRGAAIDRAARADAAYLSIFPNEVVARLDFLEHDALQLVKDEVHARPERWRPALREAVDEDGVMKWSAAALLDEIGDRTDIPRLRRAAQTGTRGSGAKDVGRHLARRLADKVYVTDLGRVSVLIGGEPVSERHVRRKVLALLCYLISRPDFAATRDQVVDALWPDLEPEVALNSLNQTVYFLRRVFEPRYSEVLSPGYLVHDANVLWLDRELVDARSAECWRLVAAASAGGPDSLIDALASTYSAKFALDFAYEEWAIAYRDALHAAVLQVVELAIARDTASGAYTRAIDLARRAILFDPDADHLELALLRLYRLSGAHAAAAEQYAHYAAVQRTEFGVDPPPLEMV